MQHISWSEYINLLSKSPLKRVEFDALLKKQGIIYDVEDADEYDQSVLE